MFSALILFTFPILVLSVNASDTTLCYQSSVNNLSLAVVNQGWSSCNRLDKYLSPTGDLFGKICPGKKNFGLKCGKKIVKCSTNIALCIGKNPLYSSQLKMYKRLKYRMKYWSSYKFNSSLALARKLRPPNGGDNGAFDALSNKWLRRHHPDAYKRIKTSLAQLHINQKTLSCLIIQLCRLLNSNSSDQRPHSSIQIIGRIKSIYSIWSKEQRIAAGEEEHSLITDQISIKVIVDTVADCYSVFNTLSGRFSVLRSKDYISNPKKSGYQAIHVVLFGSHENQFVEIQIVTNTMNEAQMGADHSRYKTMQDTLLYE